MPPSRPALRTVLIAAIAGPLAGGMGLSTALWYSESASTVHGLAEQLADEIGGNVASRVTAALDVPHAINRSNADLLRAGVLPLDDPGLLEPHFFRQLQTWPTASYVQLGRADGWFVGVERTTDGFAAETTEPDGSGKGVYPLDARGLRAGPETELVHGYDARTRPWFTAAVDAGHPTWSEVYQYSSRDAIRLGITAVEPVRREGEFLGVVGTDITLSHFSALLDSSQLGAEGLVFVIEQDGTLVASSALEQPFRTDGRGEAHRMLASEAPGTWTRLAAEDLDATWLEHGNARAFLRTYPLRDERGIDWTIAVVLPEAALLAGVNASTRQAMGLSLLIVLGGAILAGILAGRIGRPIQELASAAGVLDAEDTTLPRGNTREVAELSAAFQALKKRLEARETALERIIETRTEAMEAAREAERAKGAFLANMSHELRTPLNAILGYGEMLEDEVDEEHAADVAHVLDAGRHLLGLIEQILELARVEAGRIELSVDEVLVEKLIEEVLVKSASLADEAGNRLRYERGPLYKLSTDRGRVQQILHQLVSNAVKFTRDGEITVFVEAEGRGLALRVRDTGPGIEPEQLDRIFDAFAQADEKATRVHGGTGLGLAIARRLAEALGGSLTATSKLGEGSTFTLWLPRST
ncbi:MAG: sensor histidine kinase [Deltaproteobacteria bacterium]|nr:MAG: sensor histidine kinase [Deltaproteobacteria bacterium]